MVVQMKVAGGAWQQNFDKLENLVVHKLDQVQEKRLHYKFGSIKIFSF